MIPLFFLWDGGATVAGTLICETGVYRVNGQDATFGLTGNVTTVMETGVYTINGQSATFSQAGELTGGKKRKKAVRPVWPNLEELLERQKAKIRNAAQIALQIEKAKMQLSIAETQAQIDKAMVSVRNLEAKLNRIDQEIAEAEEEEMIMLLTLDD